MNQNINFTGKVIVITGGATGIGAATAQKIAALGGEVFVLDIQPLPYQAKKILFLVCDISQYIAVQSSIEKILKEKPVIDGLFANAGKYYTGTVEETPLDVLDDVINVNFKGIFYVLKMLLPVFKKQQTGAIVLMGSNQSFIVIPESAVYGATKAAIAQLTKNVAIDYASHHIRINCVCPGPIATSLCEKEFKILAEKCHITLDEMQDRIMSAIPMKRMGEPLEVANVVCFLLSDLSSFMTGSLVSVDGGYIAQ
jgi:NAD(P)-dependent dehydrogenase (short-subunit alcohol dehydrogenase family)